MYPMRVVRCQGQGQGPRAMRCGPSSPSRGLASFLPGPYIRHARGGYPFAAAATDASNFADFNPWFRNFDEQMTRAFDSIFPSATTGRQSEENGEASSPHQHRRPVRTFEPRFDVRETEHAYELRGELPGVEPSGVSVEFSDANTLVISGSTESSEASSSEGRPSAVEQQQQQSSSESEKVDATTTVNAVANETSDTASVASNDSTSSYVKPTVEDEDAPATSAPAATGQQSEQQVEQQQQQQAEQQQQPTYWYTERTTGTFQRTFRFPANGGRGIDIDGVTATLKNGVLDVKVPKVVVERRSVVVN